MLSGTRGNDNLLKMYLFTRETLGHAKILVTLRITVSCCTALTIFVAILVMKGSIFLVLWACYTLRIETIVTGVLLDMGKFV